VLSDVLDDELYEDEGDDDDDEPEEGLSGLTSQYKSFMSKFK